MATETQSQPSLVDQLVSLLKAKGNWDRPFNITAIFKVKEGKEKEFLEAMHKAASQTVKEAGVITYEFSQDFSDPASFILQENYKDGPSLQFHTEQTYTKEFLSLVFDITTSEYYVSAPLTRGSA